MNSLQDTLTLIWMVAEGRRGRVIYLHVGFALITSETAKAVTLAFCSIW